MIKKMRILPLFFLCLSTTLFAESAYELKGIHFLATFRECDEAAIFNSQKIEEVMEKAIQKTGATILRDENGKKNGRYDFVPQGTTQMFLLSESHASIHTYPEHRAFFVDLFTCGDHCDWKPFYEELKAYFKTEKTSFALIERSEEMKFLDPIN